MGRLTCSNLMETPWKYIGATGLGILASCLVVTLGFNLATGSFRPPAPPPFQAEISRAQSVIGGHVPTSPLLGRAQEELVAIAAADDQRQREGEWVEVTDAVNMRSGGSSSDPVIKVQIEGKRLRVASRDGGWVEVVEPETEVIGWVYERYVKLIDPESQQARLVDAER